MPRAAGFKRMLGSVASGGLRYAHRLGMVAKWDNPQAMVVSIII